MRPLTLLAVAAVALSACTEAGPPAEPPEGWVAASDTRWYVPGTDTTEAFRDVSTIEAMGVARDESEFVRWFQEQMTDIYRTSPEIVDSVFAAEFLPVVREGVPAGDDYGPAAEALLGQVKRDFYQRYNPSRYDPPDEPLAIPSNLASVGGQAVVQVYINEATEPVAVTLVEGTGTRLDQIAMRRAIDSDFTESWVRTTAGRSAGTNVPNLVRITSSFGG